MLNNLNDLKKLIDLCQKSGIETIKLGDIEVKFNPYHEPSPKNKTKASSPKDIVVPTITEDTRVLTDELTEEQLLFYSITNEETAN